jgi:uncharacterized membrane protein YhiD involved in acid resistance
MMEWLEPFTHTSPFEWRKALVSILLAFGLTQAIAGTYMVTFRGLSYSRTVVQGMAMASIITSMLMLAVGNSIAAGIGIAGGLSAIRFRTTLRDPRDIIFVFASLGAGIAAGAQAYAAAIAGTGIFVVASLTLHFSGFGMQKQLDGLLRFTAPSGGALEGPISKALRENCRAFVLVTLREAAQGTLMEHAYQISIPNPDNRSTLVSALKALPGVQDVTLLLQEPTLDL